LKKIKEKINFIATQHAFPSGTQSEKYQKNIKRISKKYQKNTLRKIIVLQIF
jgi:hypothetical protein